MNRYRKLARVFISFSLWLTLCAPVLASELQQEYVTTTPVLTDGVLYVASSIYPGIVVIYGPSIFLRPFRSLSGMLQKECRLLESATTR